MYVIFSEDDGEFLIFEIVIRFFSINSKQYCMGKLNPVTQNKCMINTYSCNVNDDNPGFSCRDCSQVAFREVYLINERWSGYCQRFRRRVSGEDVCSSVPDGNKPMQGKYGFIQLSLLFE